jgi:xanthine dehydrogenase accessory factor
MLVLIRGGGDLASGVAVRLHRSGFQVLITELEEPLVIRRTVSFAEAVYERLTLVEDIVGELIDDSSEAKEVLRAGRIPVLIDPDLSCLNKLVPEVVVDARMLKKPPARGKEIASLVIGLGPGFIAGDNCHAVIETNRGHNLGRVIWDGEAEPNTGIPGEVMGYKEERVLRAPEDGVLHTLVKIGEWLEGGKIIGEVDEMPILVPFDGLLRGLLRDGTLVSQGMKIGDIDPRQDPTLYTKVSDKALAIGGGVLETILACPDLRTGLWIS